MGLSRNKVAVSEGAAGSPPFYGESNLAEINCRAEIERETKTTDRDECVIKIACCSIFRNHPEKKRIDRKKQQQKQTSLNGGVAQLGEHLPCKQGVMGSNPIISTRDERSQGNKGTRNQSTYGLIAQVARARA